MSRVATGVKEVHIQRMIGGSLSPIEMDLVAAEEPLEVQVSFNEGSDRVTRTLSITMRTPGHDRELAAGLLHGENLISDRAEISTWLESRNLVRVELQKNALVSWPTLQRNVITSSSCGICGTTSIAEVPCRIVNAPNEARISAATISSLPQRLRDAQRAFDQTGSLHAAALFDLHGRLVALFEDVGRHNALDKLIGAEFLKGQLPLTSRILVLSGRVSFELVQKSLAAGLGVVVAVGAPSSLAVDLAHEVGLTLIGFARGNRFNIYSGASRIQEVA